MATEFKLYNVNKEDLYVNKSKTEKEAIRKQMVEMAKTRGIKPTARYYNTYPSTVRRYLKKWEEEHV